MRVSGVNDGRGVYRDGIAVYVYLQEDVHEVLRTIEQTLSAVSFIFFEQAQLDRRLSSIGAELHRIKVFS
jgi:hypothetical protein